MKAPVAPSTSVETATTTPPPLQGHLLCQGDRKLQVRHIQRCQATQTWRSAMNRSVFEKIFLVSTQAHALESTSSLCEEHEFSPGQLAPILPVTDEHTCPACAQRTRVKECHVPMPHHECLHTDEISNSHAVVVQCMGSGKSSV